MQKSLLLSFLLLLAFSALGQGTFQPKRIDNTPLGIVYDKEASFNFRLHTNGFAAGVNIGTIKTFYRTRFYQFEIGGVRHPKEYRQNFDYQNTNGRTSRAFVFGKRNSLIALRAGIGEKRYLTEKAKKRGLSAGYTYVLGGTLAVLKPYYMELRRSVDGRTFLSTEKYSAENEDVFLDVQSGIFGAAPFWKGFDEVSVRPGLHGKAAVHLDWGAFDEMVKAIEVGLMLDVYFSKVPLMVENDSNQNVENQPFFLNLYINFELGKRW